MKPYRNEKYRNFVKSLPCSVTGIYSVDGSDIHHIIGRGMGGMGTKASDLFSFPLCRYEHTTLHNDRVLWEGHHGSQWLYVANTLRHAIDMGEIEIDQVIYEINSQITNIDDKEFLLKQLEGF